MTRNIGIKVNAPKEEPKDGDTKNPFNNSELMLHQRWNKSGQGMPKVNEAGRIHCNFDAADAKGTWTNFMKNNIGG